jgi:hypothetical protein
LGSSRFKVIKQPAIEASVVDEHYNHVARRVVQGYAWNLAIGLDLLGGIVETVQETGAKYVGTTGQWSERKSHHAHNDPAGLFGVKVGWLDI